MSLSGHINHPVFRLYDAQGRLVLSKNLGVGIQEISAQQLKPGFYFWEVVSDRVRVKNGTVVKTNG